MLADVVAALQTLLDRIVQLLSNLPTDTPLMTAGTTGTGFAFVAGQPYTEFGIATNDIELAMFQRLPSHFLDLRTMLFYSWDAANGWTFTGYNGGSELLRPGTLIWSPRTLRGYYCDRFIRLTELTAV